ncbi:MAG: hypothetical protein FGM24_06585 [Candidatus Kapabacteria bacterium]|nr:hypothetical protein [Candidatus Kapabacteria bacterium]
MNLHSFRLLIALALAATLSACNESVLDFPVPTPAKVRIVNTSRDADTLGVVIDSTIKLAVARGAVSAAADVSAGRPITFIVTYQGVQIGRDTARYTLGANGSMVLFARGSKQKLLSFNSPVQDTTLAADEPNAFVKFTNACEYDFVEAGGLVELFTGTGDRVFKEQYPPDITSPHWSRVAPGTYTFVLREAGTTRELARIDNVTLAAGKSYMIFCYDRNPPALDDIGLSIF